MAKGRYCSERLEAGGIERIAFVSGRFTVYIILVVRCIMYIGIAADHGGYDLKERLKETLQISVTVSAALERGRNS